MLSNGRGIFPGKIRTAPVPAFGLNQGTTSYQYSTAWNRLSTVSVKLNSSSKYYYLHIVQTNIHTVNSQKQ